MRVLLIGINYLPEPTGIGPYTAGLAEHLAARGDDVTVLTGLPHYPAWRIARSTPRALLSHVVIHGIRVIRAAHYVPARPSAIKRALYEGTFGLSGLIGSLGIGRPDAVIGVMPSLSGGVLARLTAQRLGVPYGVICQDLMGQAVLQSGMAGGVVVATLTAAAEAWVIARARAIGVVAEAFAAPIVSMGFPPERVHHVPNWTLSMSPDLSIEETRQHFGWTDDRQVVLHGGNMGFKQGLDQVIDAARLAEKRHEPVRFILEGDGNQAADIRAAARGLANVDFIPVQPAGLYASLLAAADVLLLSERSTQVNMSLPSKLTAYFASGRPIVAAVPPEGVSAAEVARSNAGLLVPADEPDQLLAALERLRREPETVARLGAAGPPFAEAHSSAAACLARAEQLVDAIVSGNGSDHKSAA